MFSSLTFDNTLYTCVYVAFTLLTNNGKRYLSVGYSPGLIMCQCFQLLSAACQAPKVLFTAGLSLSLNSTLHNASRLSGRWIKTITQPNTSVMIVIFTLKMSFVNLCQQHTQAPVCLPASLVMPQIYWPTNSVRGHHGDKQLAGHRCNRCNPWPSMSSCHGSSNNSSNTGNRILITAYCSQAVPKNLYLIFRLIFRWKWQHEWGAEIVCRMQSNLGT